MSKRRRLMHMPDFRVERRLRQDGYRLVAGLDEAGRGAWAGPLYAAAVILPLDDADTILRLKNEGVRDGKRITPNRRETLSGMIEQVAIGWGVGSASTREVDEHGVVRATQLAMLRALENLDEIPDFLLIDGRSVDVPEAPQPRESLAKGERQARAIAAASIVAKVARDHYMRALDEREPDYGFAQHKGYGTVKHRAALNKYGPCREHRYTFKPIALLDGART